MLPQAHLTSHSRMSGSRWMIIRLWLSGSLRPFFVHFFCVFMPPLLNVFCFCYVHTILSFILPISRIKMSILATALIWRKYDPVRPGVTIHQEKSINLFYHHLGKTQHIKKQRHHFANKDQYSQSYSFSSSHVMIWELIHDEGQALKNWWFSGAGEHSWESLGQRGHATSLS